MVIQNINPLTIIGIQANGDKSMFTTNKETGELNFGKLAEQLEEESKLTYDTFVVGGRIAGSDHPHCYGTFRRSQLEMN